MLSAFPPIAAPNARVLILGSMPGAASLAAGQYYAHPRNGFWRLVGQIYGIDPELPYAQRTELLRNRGIALWDVLASCRREGSLDSAIERDSVRCNDFARFFAAHPGVQRIGCNGSTAYDLYRRLVMPGLAERYAAIACLRLPSTSPAHARLSEAEKCALWAAALAGGVTD